MSNDASEIFKALGQLEATVQAAHSRLDKHESAMRLELESIHGLMTELRDWMKDKQSTERAYGKLLNVLWAIGGAGLLAAVKFLISGVI